MRKIIFLIAFALCATLAFAQPSTVTYQGILTDNAGALINGSRDLVFKVYDAANNGTLLATDTHAGVTLTNGLFNVELSIGSVDFAQNLWLEITVAGTVLTPRVKFNATGYALASNPNALNALIARVYILELKTQLLSGKTAAELYVAGASLENLKAAGANLSDLIGQTYQGGKIAYFLESGDLGFDANVVHGIIAAPSDQSDGIPWDNGINIHTAASVYEIGMGASNTSIIVAAQGAGNYAAKLCYDLVLNDYDDWFLPSTYELQKILINKNAIGGFSHIEYWSSTDSELHSLLAFCNEYLLGSHNRVPKSELYRVRAIRYF